MDPFSKNGLKQDRPFCWGLKTWPFFGGTGRVEIPVFFETPRVPDDRGFQQPDIPWIRISDASGKSVENFGGERLELLRFGCVGEAIF